MFQKHYPPVCYEETLENIRGTLGDGFIWVAVDERVDSVRHFF
jgi:hypothetical protein